MEDISLHILDIAENSVNAGANLIRISVAEDLLRNRLTVEIEDNGRGIEAEKVGRVTDPFFTTRTTRRVGLGLPLLKQSAEEAGGGLTVTSQEKLGTKIIAWFVHSHIDRRPLGDIAGTMLVLITGNPDIDFVFTYRLNEKEYVFDTRPLRKELEGVPLNSPDVIAAIRGELVSAIEEMNSG